jgi:hypothetical protein
VFNLTHMGENDRFLAGTGSPTTASDLIEQGTLRCGASWTAAHRGRPTTSITT